MCHMLKQVFLNVCILKDYGCSDTDTSKRRPPFSVFLNCSDIGSVHLIGPNYISDLPLTRSL